MVSRLVAPVEALALMEAEHGQEAFEMGNPKVNVHGANCCGKPIGCTSTTSACLYLRHPWKRAHVFGEKLEPQNG